MGKRRECKAVNFQAAARSILLCLWSTQSQMQGSKLILQYWWRVYAICNMHNTDNASSTKIINLASLWSVPLSPAFGKSKSPCNSPITICWFASQFKEPTLDWRHKKQPSWYKKGPTAQKISFFYSFNFGFDLLHSPPRAFVQLKNFNGGKGLLYEASSGPLGK